MFLKSANISRENISTWDIFAGPRVTVATMTTTVRIHAFSKTDTYFCEWDLPNIYQL